MKHKMKILVLTATIVLLWNDMFGQQAEKPADVNCPVEKIEVHLSGKSALAGEILCFKVYCTSSLFPKVELSNIAFIELISSDNASVIRKKILLKSGEGVGEFEIPAKLPTGLYYVLAYTNLMKNLGEASFFRKDILIVNPYQTFTNKLDSATSAKKQEEREPVDNGVQKLKVTPDKKKYTPREQVNLKIETVDASGKAIAGSFSVSVFRKEPAMVFTTKQSKEEAKSKYPEKLTYLPDYKGIRFLGKLTNASGNTAPGAYIIASMPGPGTDIKSSTSDSIGNFHFLIKPKEGDQDIIVTLPGNDIKIDLEEPFWNGFRNLPDNMVYDLNQEAISFLKEKFTYFQLENWFKKQYFIKKQQTKTTADSSVFYSKPYQYIDMNAYLKLDSLREYFYELAPLVKFITNGDKVEFSITDPRTSRAIEEKPGVFLDGVLYNDYSGIARIPVGEIDRISILPKTYYYKDFTFGGIVDIHTKKSDFNSAKLLPNMSHFIFPMSNASEWKFSAPDYSVADSLARIPDFRYLLHWAPDIKVEDTGGASVRFYTGDLTGAFIVKVVGITKEGDILQAENVIYVY